MGSRHSWKSIGRVLPSGMLLIWIFSAAAFAQSDAREDDPVLKAMQIEVDRCMQQLSSASPPAYFLAVEVTGMHRIDIMAEDGALHGYAPFKKRFVDVDIRVGSPKMDSSHALRDDHSRDPKIHGRTVPLTDDVALVRRPIWKEIDRRFTAAQERWAKVESERDTLVKEPDALDLSPTEVRQDLLPVRKLQLDTRRWEGILRKASGLLAKSVVTLDGNVHLSAVVENRRYVSSEGSRLRHGQARYRLTVTADTIADDGEQIVLVRTWEGGSESELPAPAVLYQRVAELDQLLATLRSAPEQEPYSGPAILSGAAASVFFHEVLGHRLEGHRLKRVSDAQTFRSMLGKKILPEFLSVIDDPTRERHDEQYLFGHYRYDNQGVQASRVTLVDQGILTGFLESRSTSGGSMTSNGHGRRQVRRDAVARQGNFIVEASQALPEPELRRRLIDMLQRQGKPYGLYLQDLSGGFTLTGRTIPNSFTLNIVAAKRIYADGRPDEVVRGIDLIGTPLVSFSRIVAVSEQIGVFNGYCGAESGSVPVSSLAPSMLLSQIETQRKAKSQNTAPLLPAAPRSDEEARP